MLSESDLPNAIQKRGRISVADLDPGLVANGEFKALPEGMEGAFLVTARHPLSETCWRVDEVGDAMRPLYRAECEALGYELISEAPSAVIIKRAVRFPYAAVPKYPQAVNELVAIGRAIDKEKPVAASKPGRVETNLYALVPKLKAINKTLLVDFYDCLIDFYLDADNQHYADRQAKAALGAMPKGKAPLDWLLKRVSQLLDRGFYASRLVDTALKETEKKKGKPAALDLHLDIVERILTQGIEPNLGTEKTLASRVKAQKAGARYATFLLDYLAAGRFLGKPKKSELAAFSKAALAALDKLDPEERTARLISLAEYAGGTQGSIGVRHDVWQVLWDRFKELPALEPWLIRLAIKLLKADSDDYLQSEINESYRRRLGKYLKSVAPDTLAQHFDAWALELESYDIYARSEFFDTFTTLEEMLDKNPGLLKHPGIMRACTRQLLLGVVYAHRNEDYVGKLHEFLDITECEALRPEDFVQLVFDLFDNERAEQIRPTLGKVATHSRAGIQDVLVGIAERAQSLGIHARSALQLLAQCAA